MCSLLLCIPDCDAEGRKVTTKPLKPKKSVRQPGRGIQICLRLIKVNFEVKMAVLRDVAQCSLVEIGASIKHLCNFVEFLPVYTAQHPVRVTFINAVTRT
jgi:hypothetical protein